jgi:crotonobetainyl-CoA:carnitine CoA-transferase CaiB-like acyl-CoA transferase
MHSATYSILACGGSVEASALTQPRVTAVEISGPDGGAAYCGKLLARWGVDVTRLDTAPSPLPDADEAYLHAQKQRVPVTPAELRAAIEQRHPDLLICDLSPAAIAEFQLDHVDVDVRVFITPFGRSGPRRDAPATAATLLALGGYTFLSGDPGRAPLTMPGRYPYYQAASYAYVAALSHLWRGSNDVTVDVSVLETVASLHQFTDTFWTFQQIVRSRHGNRWENLCPTTLLPCADGWLAVNVVPNFWTSFALWVGGPELADDETLATNGQRMEREDEVEAYAIRAFRDRTMFDLFREGQETWRVPVGYTPSLRGLLEDPHLAAREAFQQIEFDERSVWLPGSPFRLGDSPPPGEAAGGATEPMLSRGQGRDATVDPTRPLEGMRVLDLTRIWSGPLATRILGDLGADVLKLEAPTGRGAALAIPSSTSGRPWNQQPLFNKLNRNKRSVALDLKHPRAREVFLRLVDEADVLVENFSARAMDRLELGYEVLSERNPRLIYMQMPALGRFGPYRDYVGLGPSIEPLSGLTAIMGYAPDQPRVTSQAVTDAAAGVTAATAIMTALSRRDRTGEGCLIDLSQGEAMMAYLGEWVVDEQLSGAARARFGNADPRLAPHGVYRCAGDDDWICIAVQDDLQWDMLAGLAAQGWEQSDHYRTASARIANRERLDAAVEAWTMTWDKIELSERLIAAGVPAGAVQSAPEFLGDRQLVALDYFSTLATSDTGPSRYDGSPITIQGQRGHESWRGAPGLGEHNDEALSRVGYDSAEIATLRRSGVIVDRPPDPD